MELVAVYLVQLYRKNLPEKTNICKTIAYRSLINTVDKPHATRAFDLMILLNNELKSGTITARVIKYFNLNEYYKPVGTKIKSKTLLPTPPQTLQGGVKKIFCNILN